MGLVNDPNQAIKIPNFKEIKMKQAKKIVNDDESEEEEEVQRRPPPNIAVAEVLEKEAKARRPRKFM